jgi:HSP20 family protein
MSEWEEFYKKLRSKYTFFQVDNFNTNIFEDLKNDFEEEFERQTEQIFRELEQKMSENLKNENNNYSDKIGTFVYEFSINIEKNNKPKIKKIKHIKSVSEAKSFLEDLHSNEELIDILENEKEFKIILEMLGIKKSEIKIRVTEDSIIVFTENKKYLKKISMPKKIKPNLVKSTYNNGILEINVRKMEKYKQIRK